MHIAGILPEDAPDPLIEALGKAGEFPLPVIALATQPSLEPWAPGLGWSADGRGRREMTIALTYTLYRNPSDRGDPANLADLDEQTRASLDEVPPWPRPAWLIALAERMRYPMLSEAVRTIWLRERDDERTLEDLLLEHVNHVLDNDFREQRGWVGMPWDRPAPEVTVRAVQRGIPLLVDGAEVEGIQVDTDPFVYGVAADLRDRGLFTAVLPRDELEFIDVSFVSASVDELMG